MNYQVCNARNFLSAQAHEGIILDVRTDAEHAEKRIAANHAHVPLDRLQPQDFMMRHGLSKDCKVYILCLSGKRSAQAAEKFIADGYKNIHVIEGGIIACEESGHAINRNAAEDMVVNSSDNPSLERQTRVAAGIIVAAGLLLAFIFHPVFSLISLLAAGDLIFSDLSERYGIGRMLVKAPWNINRIQTVKPASGPDKGSVCS